MNIQIQASSPLTIREQIKRQIRMHIQSGTWPEGSALPSARDLAALLGINRNTVTQAYKELAGQGLLEVVVGSGTFVRKAEASPLNQNLKDIFGGAISRAMGLGLSRAEVIDSFYDYLASSGLKANRDLKLLVIDCNQEVIRSIQSYIRDEFGLKPDAAYIQDLEADPAAARRITGQADLIICGFNHVKEIHHVVPDLKTELLAVLFKTDALVLNQLLKIPPQTRVGYVCANQRSTETFFNSSMFSQGRELKRVLAGLADTPDLGRALRDCQVIFVTGYVYDRVRAVLPEHPRLIRVNLELDESSKSLIGQAITAGNRRQQ